MAIYKIIIKGAREHNLKNISLELPRDMGRAYTHGYFGWHHDDGGLQYERMHTFVKTFKRPRSDIVVLLTTFFLTVFIDLTVAIEVSIVMGFMEKRAQRDR